MAEKKQALRPRRKTWKNQGFGPDEGGRKENKSHGLAKTLEIIGKQGFGQDHQMARKKQARGLRRRTMESPRRPWKIIGKQGFATWARGDWLGGHWGYLANLTV